MTAKIITDEVKKLIKQIGIQFFPVIIYFPFTPSAKDIEMVAMHADSMRKSHNACANYSDIINIISLPLSINNIGMRNSDGSI